MTPSIRPHEQRLIALLPELQAARVLTNTAGRGQFAAAYARSRPEASVTCWFLDFYQQQQANLANQPLPANLRLHCEADPPADEVDLVAWLFSRQGEAELTREMLQLGHQRLAIGGRMVAAIDHASDQWLHELLRGMFAKVTRRPSKEGTLYLATKTQPLKKIKDYACELAFKGGERLIHLRTRPGVFSHREVDGGARALAKMVLDPCVRILDLGCGSGAVGLAAALKREEVTVRAIDSNPRAIEAIEWARVRNGVAARIASALDCDGRSVEPNTYDAVLANPPYYSNHRIAELFIAIAERALMGSGLLLVVTKSPQWFLDQLKWPTWTEVSSQPTGRYFIVQAIKV